MFNSMKGMNAMLSKYLTEMDTRLQDYKPYPSADDRRGWSQLSDEIKAALVMRGEAYLHYGWPSLPATAYMEFCRTGDRKHYETVYFSRRKAFAALVLAECVEYQGRFLDDIVNGIFVLCEESGWQLPAHNSYIRDTPQLPLPDADAPVLDLFACETGASLAVAHYLLHTALNTVSPLLSKRILSEIDSRILQPFVRQHFWWMGNGDEQMCNWTAWCTQNLLLAAFVTPQAPKVRQQVLPKAVYALDCFLKDYGEDGCCDEGAQYFRHAGLCLFNALEILNTSAAGRFQGVYKTEKLRNMAAYILHVHVDDAFYFNFADCSPIAGRAGAREYLFGKKTENPNLMAFAAQDFARTAEKDLLDEINLFNRLQSAFTAQEILAFDSKREIVHPEIFYPSVGLFIARDDTYCLAVKAGDNNDNHNHNDTGSITLYKNGLPFLIDVGVESYTEKTFSPQRYEIWTMQSAYHNLPAFAGVMQKNGPDYRAEGTKCVFEAGKSVISMDIASAYPPQAKVEHYYRTITLHKDRSVTMEDVFEGSCEEVILNLMFCAKTEIKGNRITLPELGYLTVNGGKVLPVEKIPIKDTRLRQAWPDTLFRVQIRFSAKKMTIEVI